MELSFGNKKGSPFLPFATVGDRPDDWGEWGRLAGDKSFADHVVGRYNGFVPFKPSQVKQYPIPLYAEEQLVPLAMAVRSKRRLGPT